MLKITMKIDGMMCGMCESHVNDAARNVFPVKKVTSSHSKGHRRCCTEKVLWALTVLLVSHRQSTMRIADTVYCVENGRMS